MDYYTTIETLSQCESICTLCSEIPDFTISESLSEPELITIHHKPSDLGIVFKFEQVPQEVMIKYIIDMLQSNWFPKDRLDKISISTMHAFHAYRSSYIGTDSNWEELLRERHREEEEIYKVIHAVKKMQQELIEKNGFIVRLNSQVYVMEQERKKMAEQVRMPDPWYAPFLRWFKPRKRRFNDLSDDPRILH